MFILYKGIVMATEKASPKKKPVVKPVAKKAASTKAVTSKKVADKATKASPKKVAPKKVSKTNASSISGFERYKMIEVAAYYLAEKNGFAGNSADFWIAAEKEIDKKLAKK
jgi:Protein of unknown function (DUF2934)